MDWFAYRAERAARMRRAGWSWTRLAKHFGVSAMIVKNWLPQEPPMKRQYEPRQRHHGGYRTTESRNDFDHKMRLAAHAERIRRGE